MKRCPVCHLEDGAFTSEGNKLKDRTVCSCARCGKYEVSNSALTVLQAQEVRLPNLSAYLREQAEYSGSVPYFDVYVLNDLAENVPDYSDKLRIKKLMRYLQSKTNEIGDEVLLVEHFDYVITWNSSEKPFREYVGEALSNGWIRYCGEGKLGDDFAYTVSLTMKGGEYSWRDDATETSKHAPTAWIAVNESLDSAYGKLRNDATVAELKECSHSCREAIVALANSIYDDAVYGVVENHASSYSLAKTKLENIINSVSPGESNSEERTFFKKAIDLASKFAHANSIEITQARKCYTATKMVVEFFGEFYAPAHPKYSCEKI